MPLIIAATDFSDIAQNSVRYACKMAVNQKAEVLILHSYIIPVMFSDVPMPATLLDDALSDAEEQMTALVNDLAASYPSLTIRGKVVYGDTVDILDDYEAETKPMMIVVGNSSPAGTNTWLDNTLAEEFKKLKYPVLAVPPNAEYKPVQKICFAFDNKHTGNDIALQQLTYIAAALNAEVHVVNTQHDSDKKADIDPEAKQLLSLANAQYHIIFDSPDTNQTIQDFVKQNSMDWLVMIPRKYSFFEGLFHKSHTTAISHTCPVPIVALHEHV